MGQDGRVRLAPAVDYKHGSLRVRGDVLSDTTDEYIRETAPPVRAKDDEARVLLVGDLDDASSGGRRLSGHAFGFEAGQSGKFGSLSGSFLRDSPHLVDGCRVNFDVARGNKAHVVWLPHDQDDGLATGDQLAPCLRYGRLRKI